MFQNSEYDYMKEIEKLLSEVLKDLSNLTEDNFDIVFKDAKEKIIVAENLKNELFTNFESSQTTLKITELAKLISDKFDNVVKEWQNKVKKAQSDLELIQNQKKILIYNR